MMLFLADLPIGLGAYHPIGTNNIVLNRSLVQVVESAKSQRLVNAFVYTLLLHESLDALGYIRESKTRQLVHLVSEKPFGENHIVSHLAHASPWAVLKNVPLDLIEAPKRVMEIVKNFEKSNQRYIV